MDTTSVTRRSSAGPPAREDVLVGPEWLEAHLHDPAVLGRQAAAGTAKAARDILRRIGAR